MNQRLLVHITIAAVSLLSARADITAGLVGHRTLEC